MSSRLRASPERPDPVALKANEGKSFVGSYVLGMGFVLTPEERDTLVKKNKRNAERIFPYLGGEEVNSSPTHDFERYVINFGDMTLEEAGRWPELLAIVRERVKPERDRNNRQAYRRYWWQFGEKRAELVVALKGQERCLVTSFIAKHRAFAWQPTGRVWSHNVGVFPLTADSYFGVLQSRVHEVWARLLSSTLEDRSGYRPADCFETFPFPVLAQLRSLEDPGNELYQARAAYMVATQQGLTQTYNLLKDPAHSDPEIDRLRELHVDLDGAVLEAYGWSDLPVPPYTTPVTDAERKALQAFEDEVIDRLFVLNAERAEAERRLGAAAAPAATPVGDPTNRPTRRRARRS